MSNLTEKERDLLYRIEVKPELAPHFFRRIKDTKWLAPLVEKGYFNPENLPKPIPDNENKYVNIPNWQVIQYLETISPEFEHADNAEIASQAAEIIRSATRHAISNEISNYRVWWQFSKIIQQIPLSILREEDLELTKFWLDARYDKTLVATELGENWLPKLLDFQTPLSQVLALGVMDQIFELSFVEKKLGSYDRTELMLPIDTWHGNEVVRKVAKKAGQNLGLTAVNLFKGKIDQYIQTLDNDSWSSTWRSAIEDHEQNQSDDPEDILIVGLRETLLGAAESVPEELKALLTDWLSTNGNITKRFAIYTVDQNFKSFESLVPLIVRPENLTSNLVHEVWHFLANHFEKLDDRLQTEISKDILEIRVVEDDGSVREKATAYRQACWLQAFKHKSDTALELYNSKIEFAGSEPDHPDFSSYITSGWTGNTSPIPIDTLLALTTEELAVTLNDFEDSGTFGEPGIEGLAVAFRELVKTQPSRIALEISKFEELKVYYLREIFEAFTDLWKNHAKINWIEVWSNLLNFVDDLLRKEEFWIAQDPGERRSKTGSVDGVLHSLARMIEEGVRNDEHAFDVQFLPQAQAILLLMLQKQEPEKNLPEKRDAVGWAINSTRGRILEALINLALRRSRVAGGPESVWPDFEETFNEELNATLRGVHEFGVLISMYLPNFLYLNKNWLLSKLDRIFNRRHKKQWYYAMQAYAHVNTIYKEIYSFLKEQGDFLEALNDPGFSDQVHRKIIQNIALSYLNGEESIDDANSLISTVLERRNQDELRELIWFIWTLRDADRPNIYETIRELWPRLLLQIDTSTKDGRLLASRLCDWASFIQSITDENKRWLMECVPYANVDHNGYGLVKELARLSNNQPSLVYEVFMAMIAKYSFDHPEEEIRQILKNLILLGSEGQRNAKSIADEFLKKGQGRPTEWLHEILNEET